MRLIIEEQGGKELGTEGCGWEEWGLGARITVAGLRLRIEGGRLWVRERGLSVKLGDPE